MNKQIIILFLLIGLISCESDDNFYDVTKIIEAPREIEIDKPFTFNLKLVNETKSNLKLTLDKDITKSVHFMPNWYCGDNLIFHNTPNPKSLEHNYFKVNLKPNDTLNFELKAILKTLSDTDSLTLSINDYQKDFRLLNQKCTNLVLRLTGMWVPGKSSILDAMEGYNFSADIKINNRQQATKSHAVVTY